MIKIQISYENEEDKAKMIDILSNSASIKKISKPYKSGKFFKVYVNIE